MQSDNTPAESNPPEQNQPDSAGEQQGTPNTRRTALEYLELGLSILPLMTDGSKRPDASQLPKSNGKSTWKSLQLKPASEAQARTWFNKPKVAVGIICGAISRNLAVIDFESDEVWQEFLQRAIAEGFGDVLNTLPLAITGGGGRHLYCFLDVAAKGTGLAYCENRQILIEVRGEGNYVVAPGSPPETHDSGNLYRWERPLPDPGDGLPEIAQDGDYANLLDICRGLTQWSPPPRPTRTETGSKSSNRTGNDDFDLKPGEDFNAQGDWIEDILGPHGWTVYSNNGDATYVTRPGKERGLSGTIGFL